MSVLVPADAPGEVPLGTRFLPLVGLHDDEDWPTQAVSLADLITDDAAMRSVLASGRVSDSPDDPVELKVREDMPGFEIADGHHRIAQAIREGRWWVWAGIDPMPDDEPYEGPFYDFRVHVAPPGA